MNFATKKIAARIEALLTVRGYREVAAHAESFATHGYTASQLLVIEEKYGMFPFSSPMGPLQLKRSRNPA